MGLPMWGTVPYTSRGPSKDAVNVDATAAARSPIRRPGHVRGSPGVGGRRVQRSGTAHATLQRSAHAASSLTEDDFVLHAAQLARLNNTARRPQRSRAHVPPPPVPESRNYARDSLANGSGRDGDSMPPTASRTVDELLSQERGTLNLRNPPRLRPERSPLLDFSFLPIPSFPSITRDPLRNAGGGHRHLPELTPNFAPAVSRRSDRRDHVRTSGLRARSRSPDRFNEPRPVRSFGPVDNAFPRAIDDGDETSDDLDMGFATLRRMERHHIPDGPLPSSSLRESWSPATTVDGLGDRDRSVSPIEDHWATMLSTVAPDPVAPTADSSFTSAAASASFSASHSASREGSTTNSNSVTSSRTNLTIPSPEHSRDELFTRACDTSEEDSQSDTEAEDDAYPLYSRRVPAGQRAATAADEPPARNPNRYSRRVQDRSTESRRFLRDFLTGTLSPRSEARSNDEASSHEENGSLSAEAEAELQQARAILERLARRHDISDEFWASVGLTPLLAEPVERAQQRRL